MSRHILIPNGGIYELIPIDQSLPKEKVILPKELLTDNMFNNVQDKAKLNRLLSKMSRTGISRTNNGQIKDNSTCLNINFDDAIVSCCDGNFNEKFNDFYSVLKYYGITF